MFAIPLKAIPNQQIQTQAGGQAVTLAVYQTGYALHMDVTSNDVLVIAGVICENANRIVRSEYLGFIGDFIFVDTQGTADPVYTGLGGASARFQLVYLEEADLEAAES